MKGGSNPFTTKGFFPKKVVIVSNISLLRNGKPFLVFCLLFFIKEYSNHTHFHTYNKWQGLLRWCVDTKDDEKQAKKLAIEDAFPTLYPTPKSTRS